MPTASSTHVVLIPSYNPGPKVYDTVRAARQQWSPVWVIVDGSDDGSAEGLQQMAAADDGLQVFVLPQNSGKGAAVLHGLDQASRLGFTHVLCMDSDGQHPSSQIPPSWPPRSNSLKPWCWACRYSMPAHPACG
jgi:glycosyltransferase involved in cell wall biosynthesis